MGTRVIVKGTSENKAIDEGLVIRNKLASGTSVTIIKTPFDKLITAIKTPFDKLAEEIKRASS